MRRILLLGGLLILPALAAEDFSGIWLGQIAGKKGDAQDVAFQFIQKGAALGGKMYGDYLSTPIASGTISGDLVTFIVNAQEQNGNQINDTRIRFTGRIKGREMELMRERESSTNAGNGGAVHLKEITKQPCHLKRLP